MSMEYPPSPLVHRHFTLYQTIAPMSPTSENTGNTTIHLLTANVRIRPIIVTMSSDTAKMKNENRRFVSVSFWNKGRNKRSWLIYKRIQGKGLQRFIRQCNNRYKKSQIRVCCPSTFSSITIELNVPLDEFSSSAIELTSVTFGHGLKKKPVQSSLILVTPGTWIF